MPDGATANANEELSRLAGSPAEHHDVFCIHRSQHFGRKRQSVVAQSRMGVTPYSAAAPMPVSREAPLSRRRP
jgi:hypothetical protein